MNSSVRSRYVVMLAGFAVTGFVTFTFGYLFDGIENGIPEPPGMSPAHRALPTGQPVIESADPLEGAPVAAPDPVLGTPAEASHDEPREARRRVPILV